MPDLVAAMEWARRHEPRLVFAMCAGLAPVRSALGHHGNVADTWAWLLSLDRNDGPTDRSAEWATAVAAQMAAATAHWIDVSAVAGEVEQLLPADAVRARGWLARGGAMAPAYQGRLAPILAHVEDARDRGDDLEVSIYGGFAAYMLALTGRVDEAEHHVHELVRLTRRHRTAFRVDTVGNGYAAAILVDLLRGDLRAAIGLADQPIPHDPAFSMTAAAALAHAAFIAGDRRTFSRAVDWSQQPTIPVLRYLPTFIELVARRLDGELDHAADLAEQFWEQAAPVPVSRVHPLTLLTSTLLTVGRVVQASAMVGEAASLVERMEPAPFLSAGVLASRAQLAAHDGSLGQAASCLDALLPIATSHGFVPMAVEALEQVAAIADDPALAASLHGAADAERQRIGASGATPVEHVATVAGPLPFEDALVLAQDWLAGATSPRATADAQL